MCAHCFLRKRLRATFGSMQAAFASCFFECLKSLVNIDFFGTLLSRKILNKSGLTTCLTTYGKT